MARATVSSSSVVLVATVDVRSQSGKPVARIDKQEEGCRSAHKEDFSRAPGSRVGGQQVTPTEPSSANAAGPGLERPLRVELALKFSFLAGADTIALAQRKIGELQEQIESHRELSRSLTFDPGND